MGEDAGEGMGVGVGVSVGVTVGILVGVFVFVFQPQGEAAAQRTSLHVSAGVVAGQWRLGGQPPVSLPSEWAAAAVLERRSVVATAATAPTAGIVVVRLNRTATVRQSPLPPDSPQANFP